MHAQLTGGPLLLVERRQPSQRVTKGVQLPQDGALLKSHRGAVQAQMEQIMSLAHLPGAKWKVMVQEHALNEAPQWVAVHSGMDQ